MSTTTGRSCRHCRCAVLSGNGCPTGSQHEPAQVGPVTDQITALLIALDAAVPTARRQADKRNHDHHV